MTKTEMLDQAQKNSGCYPMTYPRSPSTLSDSRTENTSSLDKLDSQLTALKTSPLKNLERHLNIISGKETFISVKEKLR